MTKKVRIKGTVTVRFHIDKTFEVDEHEEAEIREDASKYAEGFLEDAWFECCADDVDFLDSIKVESVKLDGEEMIK